MRFGVPLVFSLALAAGSVAPASAQTRIPDDLRLQESIDEAARAVAQLRSRDAATASRLQAELDGALADLRDHVRDIRSRARGDWSPSGRDDRPMSGAPERDTYYDPPVGHSQNPNEIPVGAEFDVRLQSSLSSRTAAVEDRIDATTMVDLRDERGRLLVPAGALMRGVVTSVNRATRMDRKGSLTIAFDRVTISDRSYPIRASVSEALESDGLMGEKEKIGIGAGAGAIIGAILGGTKGAVAGLLIGGGGTIAATEGRDVELPAGTVLRVRLDQPLDLGR